MCEGQQNRKRHSQLSLLLGDITRLSISCSFLVSCSFMGRGTLSKNLTDMSISNSHSSKKQGGFCNFYLSLESSDIATSLHHPDVCLLDCRNESMAVEALTPSEFPNLPWETVAADLFYWKGSTYLLVVDCLSRFIEIARLVMENSSEVIRQLKILFARHGIPCNVVFVSGPQFASRQFAKFTQSFGFCHKTSSP